LWQREQEQESNASNFQYGSHALDSRICTHLKSLIGHVTEHLYNLPVDADDVILWLELMTPTFGANYLNAAFREQMLLKVRKAKARVNVQ